MITAEQAFLNTVDDVRGYSLEDEEELFRTELDSIFDAIMEKSLEGSRRFLYAKSMSFIRCPNQTLVEGLVGTLKELGYTVENLNHYLNISWDFNSKENTK